MTDTEGEREKNKKKDWINQLASMRSRSFFLLNFQIIAFSFIDSNKSKHYASCTLFEFWNSISMMYCLNLEHAAFFLFFLLSTNFIPMFGNSLFIFEQKCSQHETPLYKLEQANSNEWTQKSNKTMPVLAHCSNSISECKRKKNKTNFSICYIKTR